MNLDPTTVSLVLGVALPLLVGVITKSHASGRVKSVILALLSAISGGISQAVTDTGSALLSQQTLVTIALSWVVAVATYYGLYKPTGTAEVVQTKTANFGISFTRTT